jgi:hypothetical protein
MTRRHKYTKYLRHQAPETMPYFDIRLHRKTPTHKTIAHLAVYCGETQVSEVCQEMSALLTGKHTAIFLPRYAFAKMSTDQIDNHFQMHEKYIRSLHQVSLAPLVTTLDLQRVEYFPNGTTIERTTREWALSLTLSDGTHAQCDLVNGTKDKLIAYLMVPAAFSAEVKPMVTLYRERIRPLFRRETKYRDGIPNLPNVIHVTSTVQTNLDLMAKLS